MLLLTLESHLTVYPDRIKARLANIPKRGKNALASSIEQI